MTSLRIPAAEIRPGDASAVALEIGEGAGNAGCRPHPRFLRARKVHFCARKQQQGSQINRHSLRDGLRLIRGLLGVPGLLASVALRKRHAKLDPSVGGSGPHDFARPRRILSSARTPRAEHPHVHRVPLPTSVTIAIRPSCGGGMQGYNHDVPKNGSGIFFAEGLDNVSD